MGSLVRLQLRLPLSVLSFQNGTSNGEGDKAYKDKSGSILLDMSMFKVSGKAGSGLIQHCINVDS